MVETPGLLLHFLLEELGSVGCFATSIKLFKSVLSQSVPNGVNVGTIAFAD